VKAVCAALSLLFAFVALAQPVEARIDYAPAAWSSR
jgi:hypothetical protein